MPKEFYRPDELAVMLRVSKRTIYRWINSNMIVAVRVGKTIRIPCQKMPDVAQKYTTVTVFSHSS